MAPELSPEGPEREMYLLHQALWCYRCTNSCQTRDLFIYYTCTQRFNGHCNLNMGSSKFEFETYKRKKFKTNKLGEREYTVGCVPYETSPLVCHREDAVRKEHGVFVLIWQLIGRKQHRPPLTTMCKVHAIFFNLTVVPSYQFRRWPVAWLIPMLDKGPTGKVSPL